MIIIYKYYNLLNYNLIHKLSNILSGGAQDNQLYDIINQLESCIIYNEKYKNRKFNLVISGDYVIKNINKLENIIKNDKYIKIIKLE